MAYLEHLGTHIRIHMHIHIHVLIRSVDGVRTLLPPGFARLAPKIATDQTLAELADLMGAQSNTTNRDDTAINSLLV